MVETEVHANCEARAASRRKVLEAGDRMGLRLLFAIVCVSGLSVPAFATAVQLAELKSSLTQAVSDAARKEIESGQQRLDATIGQGSKPEGQPPDSPQSNSSKANAAGNTAATPVANADEPTQCISRQANGANIINYMNTCDSQIWMLYQKPGEQCARTPLKPERSIGLSSTVKVWAACRRNATEIAPGSCGCPAGTQL